MSLGAGKRFGPYEVVARVGAGGMGEVYRALDTRLDRPVALKVLPDAVAADPERLARLTREAKTLAALNHPNIAQIYGFEDRALAMEFVEGEDLSARIARGAIRVDEALQIAGQIADALEAAHEFGVIHRDLKPSNIRVRADGVVKVLDFGLAKALAPPSAVFEGAAASTITSPAVTMPGEILGTAAYMAPEQARGKDVDKRADIWAFGVVLYEMTTGRRPFDGESVTDTVAGVVKSEPDWATVPPRLRRLLKSCLEKDPKKRLRDIGDWKRELDRGAGNAPPGSQPRVWWGLAGVATLAAAAIAVLHFGEAAPVPPLTVRFQIPLPASNTFTYGMAIAPDGRHIAFSAKQGDQPNRIWVRALDAVDATPVAGTEGAKGITWSPDGRSLAFTVGRALKRVPIEGGAAQTLYEAANENAAGSCFWARRGVIVIGGGYNGSIWSVPESGGVATPLTRVDTSRREVVHGIPAPLPDGRHFLYTRVATDPDVAGVYIGSLDREPADQDPSRLLAAGNATYYTDNGGSGYLLYLREGALLAHAFDAASLKLVGEPVQVSAGVANWGGLGLFASEGGLIAYRLGARQTGVLGTELTWFDREGNSAGTVGRTEAFETIRLSPDNSRAAVMIRRGLGNADPGKTELWAVDLDRGGVLDRRSMADAPSASAPAWSPDGAHIVFSSTTQGVSNLVLTRADGGNGEDVVFHNDASVASTSWSRDGRFLLFQSGPRDAPDIWVLTLADRKGVPILQTSSAEADPAFSPDTKWFAYASNASTGFEIYMRAFDPDAPGTLPGAAIRVSTQGGRDPHWTKAGRELIYRVGDDLMAVDIPVGPDPHPGEPKLLFTLPSRAYWDVSNDGTRFLVGVPPVGSVTTPITVLLNWRKPSGSGG